MKNSILSIVALSMGVSILSATQQVPSAHAQAVDSEVAAVVEKETKVESAKKAVFDHSIWTKILREHVVDAGKTTQVDYAAIGKNEKELQVYLDSLSAVSQEKFDSWPKADQLAFLLNVYNAWTVKLVLSDFENIDSIKDLGNIIITPWKKKFVSLFGEVVSLDHVEHGLIRGSGRYEDPRIHFAANCASIGCPALRREAFEGEVIEQQLEEQTKLFLSDSTRNFAKGTKLNVSSIFKWYRGDFEKGWRDTHTLSEFLFLYKDSIDLTPEQSEALELDELKISFLSYDWDLNKTP